MPASPNQFRLTRTDPLRDFKFTVNIVPIDEELRVETEGIGNLGFAHVLQHVSLRQND